MNRSLTSMFELERQLTHLHESLSRLPQIKSLRSHTPKTSPLIQSSNAVFNTFDDQLESLRLEASLLKSEDSPFIQRRKRWEDERARRLAEARAFAEAQFERLNREKELERLKLERLQKEQRRADEQQKLQRDQRAQEEREQGQEIADWDASIEYTQMNLTQGTSRPLDDWEASVEYTQMEGTQGEFKSQAQEDLSIAPDDSIYMDLPSGSPRHIDSMSKIKESLPPRPAPQVSLAPKQSNLSTTQISHKQLISLLKGLLPAKPRYVKATQTYLGSGASLERINSADEEQKPWLSPKLEIDWRFFNLDTLEEELDGVESLSLAPRAFNPSSPLPNRTISLRLKSTEDSIAQLSVKAPVEEEFNMADFEEQLDPELQEMHKAYQALEKQVDQVASQQSSRFEPSFDDLDEQINPSLKSTQEPSFEFELHNEEDVFDDDSHDLATLDPALPAVNDPFDVLDDLSFDEERLTSDFDWEGDTPTNVFGDEPTPTNIFGEESSASEKLDQDLENQTSNKGLFSRFFGRSK